MGTPLSTIRHDDVVDVRCSGGGGGVVVVGLTTPIALIDVGLTPPPTPPPPHPTPTTSSCRIVDNGNVYVVERGSSQIKKREGNFESENLAVAAVVVVVVFPTTTPTR